MREIKFRAWDIVRKRMLYNEDLWDIPYNEIFIHTPDQRALEVMQYTGLIDRNGKEIYEGDILDYGTYGKFEVVWHRGSFKIRKLGFKNGNLHYLGDCYFDELMVVGNIYEDPELLG